MPDVPANIQEFNTIAGLIFAQMYAAFPKVQDIDRDAIASAMGVTGDWTKHTLPSGRSFNEMLAYTIAWLNAEHFIRSSGGHPAEHAVLATKGLAAMHAVPLGLKESESVGAELTKAVERGSTSLDYTSVGQIIGGFIGSLWKTLGSG